MAQLELFLDSGSSVGVISVLPNFVGSSGSIEPEQFVLLKRHPRRRGKAAETAGRGEHIESIRITQCENSSLPLDEDGTGVEIEKILIGCGGKI